MAAVAMIVLTTGSLYLSSLCTSAVRALVLSFPSILATLLLLRWSETRWGRARSPWRAADAFFPGPDGADSVMLALAAGLVGLLLSARVSQSLFCGPQRRPYL